MKRLFLLFFTITFVNSISIPFIDCGSQYKLKKIIVENCKYLPCPIFMEDETAFNIHLHASFASKYLTEKISITTMGNTNEVSSTPTSCEGARICPTDEGDASFTTKLYVPDLVPFPGTLQWTVTNEEGQTIMCFKMNIILCDHNNPSSSCYQ